MNKKSLFSKLVLSGALLCAAVACQQQAQPSDQQFADSMKKYLATDDGQQTIGKTIEDYFKKKQMEASKKQQESQAAEFENQFKNPVNIDPGNSPVKGNPNAKITIIEFSDFQCPYCKRGKDVADEVLKAYPNDVKLVFKNFPLGFHKEAIPSAKAALAAHKQGKFWEMHDALFNNQSKLGSDLYLAQAKELGLNVEQFQKDMASPEIEAAVKADQAIGEKNGIQGTPGFFVGGVAVKGAYPIDHFKMIIDRLLGKAPANN